MTDARMRGARGDLLTFGYVQVLCTLLAGLVLLAACGPVRPPPPPTVVVTGCDTLGALTASTHDTPETKREILAYTKARKKLCAPAPKGAKP